MLTFYEDELHNLILIAGRNIQELISYTPAYDYHPPLQYIVNKIFLNIFGLNEFWLAVPSWLFIIASVIICGRIVYRITGSAKLSIITGLVIMINPLVLLWGSSLRWYPLWTFLTILSLYLLINHWKSKIPERKIIYIIASIFVFVFALYTNYLTIAFLFSGIVTAIIIDFREKGWLRTKMAFTVMIGAFVLFIPYLTTFIFHLNNFLTRKELYDEYTGMSVLLSGGYFLFTALFGQSIYPWSPWFYVPFIFVVVFLFAAVFYLIKAGGKKDKESAVLPPGKKLVSESLINLETMSGLITFSVYVIFIFLLLAVVSGNALQRGLMFIPMLIVIGGAGCWFFIYKNYRVNKNYKPVLYNLSAAYMFIFIIWLTGSYNVITKQHLHKSGMEVPVKELTALVSSYENVYGNNTSVVTTDFVLTYYLLKDTHLNIVSPYTEELANLVDRKDSMNTAMQDKIIFIKSYPGSLMPIKAELDSCTNYFFSAGKQVLKPVKLGLDPDYEMKLSFFPYSGIKKWRYVVYVLNPNDGWDADYLEKILQMKVL